MKTESLGDRMKNYYESVYKIVLPWRFPIIIRLDGKAFHTLTANAERPFDVKIIDSMSCTAEKLCAEIQGSKMAYVQSDEISILVYPWNAFTSEPWFGNELQKIVSVSAGIASAQFNFELTFRDFKTKHLAVFDSRVFVIPDNDVCNYFIWRQKDWFRNSIQMLAQSLFSPKELHGKNNDELKEMCLSAGKDWNLLHDYLKNGIIVTKREADNKWFGMHAPIFTTNRDSIDKYIKESDENRDGTKN